jgi:FkbM family methyltransferase
MKARITTDFVVEVDPRTLTIGGSWSTRAKGEPRLAWEPGNIQFFFDQISRQSSPLVLDIGASTGSFSLLAKFHPMRVVAFEPVPEVYEVLSENVRLNGLEGRVETRRLALSSADGTGVLKVPLDEHTGLSTLGTPTRFKRWCEVEVVTCRLDSLGLMPDFIKIDVEGWELEVVRGGCETLSRLRPPLLMESAIGNLRPGIRFDYQAGELESLLRSYGYTKFQRVGKEDTWVT